MSYLNGHSFLLDISHICFLRQQERGRSPNEPQLLYIQRLLCFSDEDFCGKSGPECVQSLIFRSSIDQSLIYPIQY